MIENIAAIKKNVYSYDLDFGISKDGFREVAYYLKEINSLSRPIDSMSLRIRNMLFCHFEGRSFHKNNAYTFLACFTISRQRHLSFLIRNPIQKNFRSNENRTVSDDERAY
jgi:hypothetical protein